MEILKGKKKLKSLDHVTQNLPLGAKCLLMKASVHLTRVSGMYARNSGIKDKYITSIQSDNFDNWVTEKKCLLKVIIHTSDIEVMFPEIDFESL